MKAKERPAPAPDFEMPDSEGKQVRLADYRGEKHLVLVFNRGLG